MEKKNAPENNTWADFIEKTRNKPPRPLLIEAAGFATEKKEALDLGAGALNATRYLLSEGFDHVTIVDKENRVEDIVKTLPQDKIEFVVSDFEHYVFPVNQFDLINAEYALPFNPPVTSQEVFNAIKRSLKSSGIFTGHLFGVRDEWNKNNSGMTFYSKEQVENLLSDMEVLKLVEEERNDTTATGGLKYWHVFYIIAKKLSI